MKISNRFPSVIPNETSEKEIPSQSNKSPVGNKYKGPDSFEQTTEPNSKEKGSRLDQRIDTFPAPDLSSIPENALTAGENFASHFDRFRNAGLDDLRDSQPPQIASPVEKYKGPDSIKRPEIESKVDNYKGPDSLTRPEIESPVDKYKGPKSLPGEPEIESRVDKYKGPDSAQKQIIQFPEGSIPDVFTDGRIDPSKIGLFQHRSSFRNEISTDSQAPQIASPVEKYKGPDSIKRPEILSKVEENKLPDSIEPTTDSKSRQIASNQTQKTNEKNSTQDTLVRMQIENALRKTKE